MRVRKKYIQQRQDIVNEMILLLATALGVYGINYVASMAVANYFSNGILSVAMGVMLYKLLQETRKRIQHITEVKVKRRHILWAFGIAFFFSVLMIMGYQLRTAGLTECGVRGKGLVLLRGICLSMVVFPFVSMLINWVEKRKEESESGNRSVQLDCSKMWFIAWVLIFIAWIPVFLAYYPNIMSYDFHRQSQEAMIGFSVYNSHHPLLHTLLLSIFLHIGEALGSLETGMALFSVSQMLIFSAVLSYCATMVYRMTGKLWAMVITAVFFALFPFVSVLSVCSTKDVLFSAFFALFVMLWLERSIFATGKKRNVIDVLFVLEGIVMIMLRNNAIYAVAVFAVIWCLFVGNRERIRVLLLCLALVLGGKGALEGIQLAINPTGRGSDSEKYSVLMQQFARVGYFHGEELDEETHALLDRYVSEEYWEQYNPAIADTIKAWVAWSDFDGVWKGNMDEVFKAWATIGLKYPNEYLDAFLCLTCGYWFWDDVTWAVVLGDDLEERMGAVHTFVSSTSDAIPEGIVHESKLPQYELFLEQIVTANVFFDWPVISNLFKPALYCWTLLLSFLLFLYTRQKTKCLITCYPLVYLATLLLGPVVQIRYVLPMIVITPILLAMWFYPVREGEEGKEHRRFCIRDIFRKKS